MLRTLIAFVAAGLLVLALWRIEAGASGLEVARTEVDGTPVTVFTDPAAPPGPAVVIAHGFAGSQQLMQPIAVTLARAGYVAVTFDARGHGRNSRPLTGDVTSTEGATATLVAELDRVVDWARALPQSDTRLALVGHSMASDIVVREAIARPDVAATVGVSLFSQAVTGEAPQNLLLVVGGWEPGLRAEALRVAGLAAGQTAEAGVRAGEFADGTARMAVIAPGVEHVGVLYSATTLAETRGWLNAAFDRSGSGPLDTRGGWIALWIASALALGWALSARLPVVPDGTPAPVPRRRFLAAAGLPALLTPPIAMLAPEGMLPVPVADYLSAHFLVYGVLCMAVARRLPPPPTPAALAAALAYLAFALVVIFLPVDRYLTSFLPTPDRRLLLGTLLVGLLPYFLADETLTRSTGHPRGAYALTKLMFLLSLGFALALDPPRLFFLVLILPVMLVFFALFGAFSRWSFATTGSPLPAALGNAVLFAWAIAVTFPILGT